MSPAWRHQNQVQGGTAPCCESTAVGTLKGGSRPPGTTSCLSSRAPWSPHLYRGEDGVVGRSELQTCLPSSLSFSSWDRCAGQGGDHRRARDAQPAPSSWELQRSDSSPHLGRESAQAFSGKSLTSRVDSGPEALKPFRWDLPDLLRPICHLSPRKLVGGKVGDLRF